MDIAEDKLAQIRVLCRKHHVRRLELFGSAARGASHPERSDVDFLVDFLPLRPGQYADAYFGLLEELEGLFGRTPDLVMVTAIRNPYFLESVDRDRKLVYAAGS